MSGTPSALLALLALLPAPPAAFPLPPVPAPAASPGDRKTDLPGLARFVASFMKKRELGKKDPEEIARKIEGLKEEDLAWVLDRLREVPAKDRGEAAGAVERIVEDALLALRFGPAVLRIRDAAKRLADPSPEARCALLADLSRLEDAEPATRFGLWALEGSAGPVRLRALETLADLCSWGGDGKRILPSLVKALEDPSPAVRDLALERLVNLSEPAALDWAMGHLGDPAEEEAEVRGVKETRRPGDRALDLVTRLSKLHFGLDGASLRGMPEEGRKGVLAEFAAWREKAGANPVRSGEEGPFDPLPRVSSTVVDPALDPAATVRWWSEVDRAQFRMDLEDMEVVAATKLDWVANFRLTVIASGARQGNWEAYARKVRCGMRYRLPRRGFGLIETSVQPLLDGKWKVWVRAFEWRSGG